MVLKRVRVVLGTDLVGMYLSGSRSSGDFDPGTSDVDFVVATARTLPTRVVERPARVPAEISESGLPWSRRPEGWYLRPGALRRHDGSARFKQVVQVSPHHWMHHLEIHDVADLDVEVGGWLREAAEPAG